jgi:C-methyltransferase C-terminal domain
MTRHPCPCCGSSYCEVFYEAKGVPANSHLPLTTREEAVALPRGDVALQFCQACGLIFNGAFNPSLVDYRRLVEESYSYSSPVNPLQHRLAHQLIEGYTLRDKDILEIGGGQGEFVELCDLIYSNNFLQNVAEPLQFLNLLRRALHNDARLFLQVFNFMRTLRNFAFWDIHYPNRSYFSPGTLHRLLRSQGFVVRNLWTDFDSEYLMADARATAHGTTRSSPGDNVESIADLAGLVARFAEECGQKQAMWCEILRTLAGSGNRVVIWGAGSRAASFLTTLAVGDEVSCVVEVNPCRQGKYTPGTGHRIVAPEVMVTMRPDVVIMINSVLTCEMRDLLAVAGRGPMLLIA